MCGLVSHGMMVLLEALVATSFPRFCQWLNLLMAQEVRAGMDSFFSFFFLLLFLNLTWGCESTELLESDEKNCVITVMFQLLSTFAGGLCVVCFWSVFVVVCVGFFVCRWGFCSCLFRFFGCCFCCCYFVFWSGGGGGGEKKTNLKTVLLMSFCCNWFFQAAHVVCVSNFIPRLLFTI